MLITDIKTYFMSSSDEFLLCLKEHIIISLISLAIAMAIGIPIGYLCSRSQLGGKWVTGFFQTLRIIPSLAVLILLIPIMGTGTKPAVTALVLLAVPPILMNTATGLTEVPDFMLEVAEGMGMGSRQVFFKVKLPLALPLITAGIKIALVEIIASATIAAKIGAGGLGGIIFTGLGLNRTDLLVIGGASVGLLSIISGFLLGGMDRLLMKHKFVRQ